MYYICILDGTFFAKMDNSFTCAKIMLEFYVNFLDKVHNDFKYKNIKCNGINSTRI